MSAPNAGRQSPELETQSDKQAGQVAGGKADAAPSATHAQEKSDDHKDNVLSSNPKGPLEDAAHNKVSKEGRGPGIWEEKTRDILWAIPASSCSIHGKDVYC